MPSWQRKSEPESKPGLNLSPLCTLPGQEDRVGSLGRGWGVLNLKLSLFLMQELHGEQVVTFFEGSREHLTTLIACAKTIHFIYFAPPTCRYYSWNLKQFSEADICMLIWWTWKLKPREAERPTQVSSKWQNRSGRTGRLPILCLPSSPTLLWRVDQQFLHPHCTNSTWLCEASMFWADNWHMTSWCLPRLSQKSNIRQLRPGMFQGVISPRCSVEKVLWSEKFGSAACYLSSALET